MYGEDEGEGVDDEEGTVSVTVCQRHDSVQVWKAKWRLRVHDE